MVKPMSALERIFYRHDTNLTYFTDAGLLFGATEYVRADVAASQLAEVRASEAHWKLTADVERQKVEYRDKRYAKIEADRDRLAAENASRDRLIYHLVSWIENEAGAELPLDEDQFNLACSIRAGLDKGAEK